MASVCISNCVNVDTRLPVRPTFANLYKWPESEVEFVKTMNSNNRAELEVGSLSCRQTYLRSYKFSRKKVGATEKTMKCFSRIKEKVRRLEGDNLSCSQILYLRSYKFSREKVGVTEKTVKCFSRIKESMVWASNRINIQGNDKILGRAKYVTHAAVSIFRRLLSRSYKFDRCGSST